MFGLRPSSGKWTERVSFLYIYFLLIVFLTPSTLQTIGGLYASEAKTAPALQVAILRTTIPWIIAVFSLLLIVIPWKAWLLRLTFGDITYLATSPFDRRVLALWRYLEMVVAIPLLALLPMILIAPMFGSIGASDVIATSVRGMLAIALWTAPLLALGWHLSLRQYARVPMTPGIDLILRLAIVAVLSLCAFVYLELKRSAPLLNLRLLARRNFGLGTCANFVFGFSMFGWVYLVPQYLSRLQGYSSQEIGGVMVWLGLPQLLLIPFIPKVMQRVDARLLVIVGYALFIGGSLLAMTLSDDFSGPEFLGSSLVRAVAQAMTMAPLSAIAIAGIESENAGSASALFNAMRNMGGAVGIAVIQTFLTKREQFHSNVLSSHITLLDESTRQRLDHLSRYFLAHGVSDAGAAYGEAVVAVGRAVRHQAFLMGFSDTIVMQSAVLGLGLAAVLSLRKAMPSGAAGGH